MTKERKRFDPVPSEYSRFSETLHGHLSCHDIVMVHFVDLLPVRDREHDGRDQTRGDPVN